jgi:hypothetical protein
LSREFGPNPKLCAIINITEGKKHKSQEKSKDVEEETRAKMAVMTENDDGHDFEG